VPDLDALAKSEDAWWAEASSFDVWSMAQSEADRLVARALGAQERRVAWDPSYLAMPDGRRIEVKVAAHLLDPYKTVFTVLPHASWQPQLENGVPPRAADGYVFAFETSRERRDFPSVEPEGWQFWVLPAEVITARGKRRIKLEKLQELAGPPVPYAELAVRVRTVVPPVGGVTAD
jgi:hypothetical protein